MLAFSFLFLRLIFPMTFSREYDIIFYRCAVVHLRRFSTRVHIITQGRTF